MPLDQESIEQQTLLASYRQRLVLLLQQQVKLGAYTPPHVYIDIREAQDAIRIIKEKLRTKGVSVIDEPEDEAQPVAAAAPSQLTAQEQRNRSRMLAKVRDFWVKGVLETSLHGAALIELGMEYKPEVVVHPWEILVQQSDQFRRSIPPGTSIIELFDELGGELLILGAPGSGKTTLLLELARDLIARTQQAESLPMPVVFNLSSWAAKRTPLTTWLVDELSIRYDVPTRIGNAWIATDQVLPLLDGLDEVQSEHRAACVDAVNAFRRDHGLVNLVVCSRIADYEALAPRLKLQGALLVQPLTAQQIDAYLVSAGPELVVVRTALQRDAMLQELAQAPLMLSIMALAYHGLEIESFPTVDSLDSRRTHLFATYVERMLQRRGADKRYTRQQTLHWLAWLARMLVRQSRAIFFIERMQPERLLTNAQRQRYTMGFGLIVGLAAWLVFGLASGLPNALIIGPGHALVYGPVDGLIAGLVFGLVFGLRGRNMEPDMSPRRRIWWVIRYGLGIGVGVGLVVGLAGDWGLRLIHGPVVYGLYGGIVGLAAGVIAELTPNPGKIDIVETIRWSWSKARMRLAEKLTIGLAAGLVVGMLNMVGGGFAAGLVDGLADGLAVGVLVVLLFGIATGLTAGEIETKTLPNQGMWRSARNALRIGGTMGMVSGLAMGVVSAIVYELADLGTGRAHALGNGLQYGLVVGLAGALIFGGLTCIKHVVLRYILYYNGSIPWNYTRFLDYAADRIFLQKVGGGYIFVHRLLMEHFAGL